VWTSYVCVESADDAATKVKQEGGSVLAEPSDVGDAGRMVVVADRSGATFGIWQPRQRKGVELVNEAGSWNSSSLNTPDLPGAQDFYGAVFWVGGEQRGSGGVRLRLLAPARLRRLPR
jgi:predicted enzyme related to lactoylglutathione lyase